MHLLVRMFYCYQCVKWNAFACTHVLLLSVCKMECICLYACVIVIIWVDAWSDVIVTFVTVYMDWCMKWCHCNLCDCVYGIGMYIIVTMFWQPIKRFRFWVKQYVKVLFKCFVSITGDVEDNNISCLIKLLKTLKTTLHNVFNTLTVILTY